MTKAKSKPGTKEDVNEESVTEPDPFDDVADDPFSDGEYESASSLIWTPEVNESLVGTYLGSAEFTEGKLEAKVDKHFVNQWGTNRRYSFVGGQAFDKIIVDSTIKEGTIVKITFLGQKKIDKGMVNLWDVLFKPKSGK